MNLFKVYAALGIFLAVCTYNAEGGIILLLLLKIIALKGALFFGMPLALGSFMLGQGMGFFGGTLFGGYSMLGAAHKYLSRPKAVAHHIIPKPVHIYHTPTVSHGWGWTPPPPKHSSFHVYKYHQPTGWTGWSKPPTIWNKISNIPGILTSRFRKSPPKKPQGWYGNPAWAQSSPHTVHGQNPLNTYYEAPEHSHKHHHHVTTSIPSYSSSGTDWDAILKQAELEAEQKYVPLNSYTATEETSHSHHETPSSTYNSYATTTSLADSDQGSYLDGGYSSDYSPSKYQEQTPESYISGTKHNEGYSNLNYDTADYPSDSKYGGYGSVDTKYDSHLEGYGSSKYETFKDSESYGDGQGLESSDMYKKIPAPNSVLEKFLEQKLQEEIQTTKTESRKRDAAQLITMLRQVYMQELVNSLDSNTGTKSASSRSLNAPSIPAFKPFPVPNSTTAKPTQSSSSTLAPSTTPSLAPAPKTQRVNPLLNSDAAEVKFVPMRTSFTINKRNGAATGTAPGYAQLLPEPALAMTPPSLRNRRQTLPVPGDLTSAQALQTFADDVKKFFLLVSLLDQDRCLQKLVCDVHTKGTDASLTPYETNIVITFKVMNAILSPNVEDSTTNYRKAAKIGELSKNMAVCTKAYPTCTYSSDQIINMGNAQAEEEAAGSSTSSPVPTASGDMQADGSEDKEQIAQVPTASSPAPFTVMPRV